MSVTFRDRYKTGVASAPGLTGNFTIGNAANGFKKFSASDEGLLFDVVVNDGTNYTDWEIRKDCTYSGGTLSRGTLVDSSTGSALNLTASCVLAVTLLAERAYPSIITTPATGDIISYNGTNWVNTAPGAAAFTEVVKQYVKNGSGQALTKGQAVYIIGADGTNILIGLAKADAESTSSKTLGLLEQDLAINAMGYVITDGKLSGTGSAHLNTSTATIGNPVWLSPSTAGGIIYGLANKPHAPNHLVYIGVVSRVSATVGEILVKVQNGFELDELHDVSTYGTKTNDDLLVWESSTSLWKNKQLSSSQVTTGLGFTPYNSTNPAGYTTNVGTVTNVTGSGPISVSTGTSTPAINISMANATTDGYLSAADWITFNSKGNPYTLPTASTSILGGVKVDGTTITINGSGVISSTGGGGGGYTLPTASTTILGGVKIDGSTITIDANGVISGASSYSLPTATSSVLGGIKIGSGLSIDGSGIVSTTYTYSLPTASASVLGGIKVGTGLSIDGSGVLNNTITQYTLPTATTTVLGGIKVDGTTITINGSGVISNGYTYTLPTATGSVLGGIKIGSGLSIDGAGIVSTTYTYSLPTASASVLGGIKVGTGLSIDGSGVLNNTITQYTLPTASGSVLGGVKVGSGLSIDGSGIISATYSYTLPTATTSVLGGVKVDGTTITINGSGVISSSGGYSLPIASASVLGGIKIGSGLSIDGSGVVTATGGGGTATVGLEQTFLLMGA
jgi:hypothetical protein